MSSKRPTESILVSFSKKLNAQASSLLREEIPLVDCTDRSSSLRDANAKISSVTKTPPLDETSNISDLNVSENDIEHENKDKVFDSFYVSSNMIIQSEII
ncbi:unnamed protein product [Adineta steineri]|uniref:Uncharacterized protein n=1 Tax=Adineta steineri TaxID=433720 RepID=A0A815VE91_9BILA|nr:unnamed protein product [Adineta steineri]CAF4219240.1 unnamed protein product [Adineta steineri]